MSNQFSIQTVRDALATGDHQHVLRALPEPDVLFPALFRLAPDERNALYTGIYTALDSDEDRWELLEGAVMHSLAHADTTLWPVLLPYISDDLRHDVYTLLDRLPTTDAIRHLHGILDASVRGA